MANLSEEEENYVRLALLLKGVTPRAVRTYFDREFLPSSLPSTIKTSYTTLSDLKLKRIINQAQWNLLVPRNGVPDSKTFDVTLMICLIRNLTSINPPINGFDSPPLPAETTPGSDLARIKWYRNKLAHHDSNAIDTAYFNTAWKDISDALSRLAGQTMYQECQKLKVKILDQSNQEIVLEIQQSLKEIKELRQTMNTLGTEHATVTKNLKELETSHSTLQTEHTKVTENLRRLQTSHNTLQTEHSKLEEVVNDPIPQHIRDQIKIQTNDWEEKDEMFVTTRASDYIIECLQENSCLTLTGPSGVGKSLIARHTALVLKKEGYTIIPVRKPDDIRDFYQPSKRTVFIVDDICGNFTASQQQIENWQQLLPVINTVIADKCCKIIVSCRLQVYKDDKFNILEPFKSCECNLMSEQLCLTAREKFIMANTYIGLSLEHFENLSQKCEFFPLLCSLYHGGKHGDVREFFKNPFIVYQNELDSLKRCGVEGKYKLCSLALLVLFNNQLKEKWFKGKVTDEQRDIIEDTCEACRLNKGTSKSELIEALNTLDGTFVYKQNGIYKTLHDKLFDFLAYYFGEKMIECLIDHGDSDLVHERLFWRPSSNDRNGKIEFIIEIPKDDLKAYLKRFITDWSAGKVSVMFRNNNMKEPLFRGQILQELTQLEKSQQVTLANMKDTVLPKDHHGSGTTQLIIPCFNGYTDMVQWMLQNDVDVNQCRVDGATGLYMASQEGHIDIVKLLLERNPKIDLCVKDGSSPLYIASQNGHTEIVKLLLERNPNIDLCQNDGCSPLYIASQNGHTEIVNLLLERNPNVDLFDNINGLRHLYVASQKGYTDVVKLLLEKSPNSDIFDENGCSSLRQASTNGHIEIVKLLLERNPFLDSCQNDCFHPLYFASSNGHTEIVKLLLERTPNVNLCDNIYNGFSPLNLASEKGYTDIVKLLLEKSPNSDICDGNGCSSLRQASKNGHIEIVKMLLERNPNIDLCQNDGSSPLYFASQNGHTEIVKLLLENSPNIYISDENGCTSLRQASKNGHTEIVKLLLERTPNIDLCQNDGSSPLLFASENGHTEIVKLLLQRNPNIDLCQNDGYSPLIFASQNGHTEIVKVLLERNVNVDLCDKMYGLSPLSLASQKGHTEIVKLLLEKNPNVDLCDNEGRSPLYIASQEGHTDIIKLLLEKNPHVDLCDNVGRSPLYIASQEGHSDIVWLLLDIGRIGIYYVDVSDINNL